jgi:outer membrane protein assembly factor BamB
MTTNCVSRPHSMKLVPSLIFVFLPLLLSAADWPAFKHDAARSSVSQEALSLPLSPAWSWRSAQAPQPAWGDPGRSLNPLDFDYAFQPVVAGGIVVLASSADDTVRAFDAASGALRWQFTCGGPVRFAPQLDGGRCYFAGDDGAAYCLDAKTGTVIWKVRLALNGQQVIANGRLASRWPCRSGVLVRGGKVYVTAGMWPSEGVFIFALDAATGHEVWCNDTSCYDFIEYPHEPSASFGGPAPQGALLASDEVLLVPTGRGVPAAFDVKTGKLLHYRADSGVSHKGGTWATLVDGTVFVTAVGWQPDIPPRLGESVEHFPDSLAAFDARTGKEEWKLASAMKATAPEWSATKWRGQIAAGILGRTRAVFDNERVFAFGNGKADAWQLKGGKVSALWSQTHGRVYAEALAANAVLLGEDGQVVALDPVNGKELWKAAVDGQARGIAVADGRLFVSTSPGALHVFGGSGNSSPQERALARITAPPLSASVEAALKQLAPSPGFALVLGGKDARLAQAIAERTKLHVINALADANAVVAERKRLVSETALYGSRVNVQLAGDAQYPAFFAGLIVIAGDAAGFAPEEWYRVLRPYGGVLCAAEGQLTPPPSVPKEEIHGGLIVRGKLTGAFDWDRHVEADQRVKWPLEFTWWGGPSAQLQKARHSRPRTPLAANGRLFVFGENTVVAVDAYTGTELWHRRLNSMLGLDAPAMANDDSFFTAVGSTVVRFDSATGKLMDVFGDKGAAPPVLDATKPLHVSGVQRQGATCEMDIESSSTTLRLVLAVQSREPQRDDAWELAFDFRPSAQRVNAPAAGAFEIVVSAWDGILRPQPTQAHPKPAIEKLADGRIALSFAWAEIEKLAGWRPTDFALAADCKLWNAKLDLTLWDKPLTNTRGRGFNDAEAVIVVSGDALKQEAGKLSPYLAVPVRPVAESPLKPARGEGGALPLLALRRPKADLSDFGAAAKADAEREAKMTVLPRAKGYELSMRSEPFTGSTGTRDYTPSYGCSGIISSATMDFMRSGSIGMYDRADDSGMRNISGIRSGCGQTLLPALGMLLYAEGTGNCLCTYNYATSFGMAPGGTQRNEDWALFNDEQLDKSALKQIAFNLGAPGDRRDANGTLWLALPRPQLAEKKGIALPVPASIDAAEDLASARINTDRHPIAGTTMPWLYGSNVRGLHKLHLDLQYYEPSGVCITTPVTAPKIDGELSDACWDGFGGVPVHTDATIWMRHDATNLYIARVPLANAKAGPFALTLGDMSGHKLVNMGIINGKVEVKRLDVPDFDRKADVRTLPEIVQTDAKLTGAIGVTKTATEIAIPWASIEALGLKRDQLRASPNALGYYGRKAPDIVRNFTRTSFAIQSLTAPPSKATYTVRLHFAELDGAQPGERLFDVLLNGKTVATSLDIAREAGGPMRAFVKEFKGISCNSSLDVELRAKSLKQTPKTAALLSAIEVLRED